jgi:MoaA/NifB/PqqE/SkfB family radical SAM enzyme
MVTARTTRVTLGRRLAKYVIQSAYAARPGKPSLKWRALRNYARYVVDGRPRLRFCDLAVTYDCTMSCAHCSAGRLGDARRRPMSVDDYGRLGDELVEAGVLAVQLTGGEPLVRGDLEEIIRALGPSRLFVSVVTNSSLATRARLESLAAAGLDNVCVSLDAWQASEHDRVRGAAGNRDQALATLGTALELGLRGMVFHVVTHESLRSDALPRLVEHTERLGVLLVLGWAVPAGSWNGRLEVLLTDEDLASLERIHEQHLHVRTDFETNYFHWGCGAVKEKLYVSCYGDVLPCAFVHIRLGNVFEEPIADIRRRALAIDWFSEYNGRCLAATDRTFIDAHLSRVFGASSEPISLEQAGLVPGSVRGRSRRR